MSKLWTDEEIVYLKENYKLKTISEIMNVINRSFNSINMKASDLKLNKNKPYTNRDDEFIINNYGKIKFKEMGKILNRSEGSISYRAQKLGISRKIITLTEEQEEQIKTMYPNTDTKDIVDIMNIPYGTIRHYAQKHGLLKTMWWNEDELQIMRDNYETDNYYNILALLPNRSDKSIRKKAFELGLKIKDEIMFDIRNSNLEGRLNCDIVDNPNFNNDKDIRNACRNRITTWRKNIIYDQKVCQLTDGQSELVVHHIRPFSKIYKDTLIRFESDYGFVVNNDISKCVEFNGIELVENFINAVKDEHEISDGVLISKTVHDKFHNEYGTRHFTSEQFYEFAMNNYGVDIKEKLNLK